MKALLYKDMLNLKGDISIFVLLIFLATLIGSVMTDVNYLIVLAYIFPIILLIKSFNSDKNANFEKFLISGGIERKNIVFSKYLLVIGMEVISLFFTFLAVYLSGNLTFLRTISILFLIMFISFIIIPIYYRFGYKRIFISMVIAYLGIVIFFALFPEEWKEFEIVKIWLNNEFLIYSSFALVTLLIFGISIFCSLRIVEKIDF